MSQLKKLIFNSILLFLFVSSSGSIASSDSEGPKDVAKHFSPYANSTQPNNVFWGDTHLHTGLSLDAGLFGNTTGPDEAYRFAKGEQVMSSSGVPARLARPLDWMVLTDHTDLMGIALDIKEGYRQYRCRT